jgi:hypothetical protein
MATADKILKALTDQLENIKITNVEDAAIKEGFESAIKIVQTFIKPKAPKKVSKKQEELRLFRQLVIDKEVHQIIFDIRGSFVWQYRMNCADVSCTMLKANGDDADDLCHIQYELQELLYTQIKKARGEEVLDATVLIDVFNGTNVQLMTIQNFQDKNPRAMTADDQFNIESGSDS